MSVGEIVAIIGLSITIVANLVCIGIFFGKLKMQSEFIKTEINNFAKQLLTINDTVAREISGMKEFFNFRLRQMEDDNSQRAKFEIEFKGCLSKMEESLKSAHHRIAELKNDIKK